MEAYRGLRKHNVPARKGLGQHFLVDASAVSRIVDAAELTRDDVVLEIGSGPGTLTGELAERAGRVLAVELDERMLAPLRESIRDHDNVHVVHGDILEQNIGELVGGRPYKVVANLPFYITSAVLRHVLGSVPRPCLVVVTVQREVADRIVGRSRRRGRRQRTPRMSLLAVSIGFYGQARIVSRIPAGSFRPMPAVDSAIVRVEVYDPLPWGEVDDRQFFRVARAGFAESRKQLRNALAHNLGVPVARVLGACQEAGIDASRRAETLSIEEWVRLSCTLGVAEA
jgi:16S rRNA (adenine1518-N6/adenine1519-N6)-dimethyltransferase